jgi:ribulose-5-phosphate 4-epimerase/fuculose-1-phosphate aldolase
VGEGNLLIKGSRSWMESMSACHVSVCRIEDGECLQGAKPSVETAFHAGILKARPEARVVLHFQSPYATVAACRRDVRELPYHVTPETPYYIGSVGHVPFLLPGSPELARAVVEQAKSHTMIILANHGQVTFGASFEETIQRAVFFEMTCEIMLRAGDALSPLNPLDSDALLELSRKSKAV